MDYWQAMQARHSVRQYKETPIAPTALDELIQEVEHCNREGSVNIQLITEEPNAFRSMMARYGKFRGVRNYIALVGPRREGLEETLGYYGEKLVLKAQMLGLNTCWVALTYSKRKSAIQVGPGEVLVCVISLGYGENQGEPHKNRPMEKLYKAEGDIPGWFQKGMEAALLAPTAINQQKFRFTLTGENTVTAEATGGFHSDIDLGIVKYHFELGAGTDNFTWA